MTGREMFDNLAGDLEEVKGSVILPVKFDDCEESILDPLPTSTLDSIKDIRNGQETVPRIGGFKDKVSAKFVGFFYKHSMKQQNDLNVRYADVAEEFARLNEQKRELAKKISYAKQRLDELESQAKVTAEVKA